MSIRPWEAVKVVVKGAAPAAGDKKEPAKKEGK
jgi:hypothetical protein